jgi:hypothetical protein
MSVSRLIIEYIFVFTIDSFIKRTKTESSLSKLSPSLFASGSVCLTTLLLVVQPISFVEFSSSITIDSNNLLSFMIYDTIKLNFS